MRRSASPDNVVLHLPADRPGNPADADRQGWPRALGRLEALGADIVVPGHGERVDPDLLEHTRALLE